jgi:uncharacterized protein with NRDE domain
LSNASLDTPWSKVVRTRETLRSLLTSDSVDESALLKLLADRTTAPTPDAEAAHLPFDLGKSLTAPFIVSPDYGTRCSTTLIWSHAGEIALNERRFNEKGEVSGESRFSFSVEHKS